MNKLRYITARDIVIPAGTAVSADAPHRRSIACVMASVMTAENKDSTSEWLMPLDEAIALGLVKETAA